MQALCRMIVLACVLTLAAAAQASAAPAYVQGAQSSASGTSITVPYPSSVGAGDLLVGMFRTASTTTVSDSANGSWTKAVGASDGVNSLWYREGSKAGADTITVTSGSSGSVRAVAGDYSGVAASGSLDGTACNTGTSSAVTTGSTASVAAGELAFAGVGMFDSPITVTAASPATLRSQFTGSFGTSADEDLTTAAGSQNLGFSLSSAPSGGWAACVATFRPATDTTPPSAPTNLAATPGDQRVSLAWSASSDNVGVAGYDVFRNGQQLAQASGTSYVDTGLTDGITYTYTVKAYDAAGNVSSASNQVSATPQGTPPPSASCDLYASPTGAGSNPGTQSSPQDLASMVANLRPGQTGCLLTGTYGQTPDSTGQTPGTGTYWDFANSGTSTAPITITAAPGDSSVPTVLGWFREDGSYVTWSHVNIDGSNTYQDACASTSANSWSSAGSSVPSACYTSSGDPCPSATTSMRYRSQDVDLNGTGDILDHDSIYQSYNNLRYNLSGIGFQAAASNVIIRYSLLHDGGGCGTQHDHLLYVHTSTGAQVYDNWFYNGSSGQGVILYPESVGTHVFDNVIDSSPSGFNIGGSASASNNLDHNVVTNLGSLQYDDGPTATAPGTFISCYQEGSANTVSYSDWFNDPGGMGSCSGATITNTSNVDPQYVNQAAHDYTVQSSALAAWGLPVLSQMGPAGSSPQ